ncbi:FAD binding domain-containing protein [Sabulicella rubraurantiaca]|uniref:FAD binding domain-containing protein n=1 Tax=Sabulicella rubraurantiaca TaxID=2811429 RepID=UPI001A9737DB|nr:xanthine dehydrogenase family protein subunit M [Sabulicella rubraurantiaca]
MKAPPFAYAAPASIEGALALLAAHEDAKVLAGGQSLMPALNLRLAAPSVLVDINAIPELSEVSITPAGLRLGALVRHSRIGTNSAIAGAVPLLGLAYPHIAHGPVRTRGTIGGSLAHADPSAEWPAVCLASDAVMEVRGPGGGRDVPAEEFSLGIFTTAIEPGELLVAIRFPAWPASRRAGFAEVARRDGDFAMVGAAVTVDLGADGTCTDARIVLFGASSRPVRRREAEARLRGQVPGAALLREAASLAAQGIDPPSDLHASAEYRRRVAPVMVRRALADALSLPEARLAS